jgi:hypothetical protein
MKNEKVANKAVLLGTVRMLANELDDVIETLTLPDVQGYVSRFDSRIPDSWVYVRKDVEYRVDHVALDRDTVRLNVTVQMRGHHYEGVVEHRLPLLALPTNSPRFVWGVSAVEKAMQKGKYDKFIPQVAGQLVLDDIASTWADVADESNQKVCDELKAEAVGTARNFADLAPLIEARGRVTEIHRILSA